MGSHFSWRVAGFRDQCYTIAMTFQAPEAKVQTELKGLLGSAYRELARIVGSIVSVALAVGAISSLFTRRMYLAIESRSAWDSTLHFSAAFLEELRFWYCNIDSFNGYSLRPPLDASTVIFSDANDVGFGGFSDRFATYYNAQFLRFNSKFASPGCRK